MYQLNIEDRNFRYTYLKQIRKDKARKMFYDGVEIFIIPNKLNHLSYHNMLKSIKCSLDIDFDELIKFKHVDNFNKKFGYLKFFYVDTNNPKEIPDLYKGDEWQLYKMEYQLK